MSRYLKNSGPANPFALLEAGGISAYEDDRIEASAPYTFCPLGALMVGGLALDEADIRPVKFVSSYRPSTGEFNATIKLTKPSSHLWVNCPDYARIVRLEDEIHSLGVSLQKDNGQSVRLFDRHGSQSEAVYDDLDGDVIRLIVDSLSLVSRKLALRSQRSDERLS